MPSEILYGRNAVLESLRAGRRSFERVMIARGRGSDPRLTEIEQLAREHGAALQQVERSTLDEQTAANHQGVAMLASTYPYADGLSFSEQPASSSIMLALDSIEDPRNVGSLLRTAEVAGVDLVVLPEHRAASITPAVVNASAGAVEHMQIAVETNLVRWLESAKRAGYWAIGVEDHQTSENLFDADLPSPAIVVIGSEGHGMRRLVRETCDLLVKIPMYGRIDSLNASVAGSIALYQLREYSALPDE